MTKLTRQEFADMLGRHCFRRGGIARLAEKLGVSASYLGNVINGKVVASRDVANELGYVRKGRRMNFIFEKTP